MLPFTALAHDLSVTAVPSKIISFAYPPHYLLVWVPLISHLDGCDSFPNGIPALAQTSFPFQPHCTLAPISCSRAIRNF